jgi:hypothetical protein
MGIAKDYIKYVGCRVMLAYHSFRSDFEDFPDQPFSNTSAAQDWAENAKTIAQRIGLKTKSLEKILSGLRFKKNY